MSGKYIGIDVGGTNIKFGCFDSELNLVCKTSVPTEADARPEDLVEIMAEAATGLTGEKELSAGAIAAVGIGAPGMFDLEAGVIINSPNMSSFKNVPLRKMVGDRFGVPAVLENDANAACWGEYVLGAGRDVRDMAFFTLGTGIGGGVITNGKLVHGFCDGAAELGHIIIYPGGRLCGCGQRGCAEAYASASSTAKRATEAIEAGAESSLKKLLDKNGQITCQDVYAHLAEGDKLAGRTTDETAEALAILCINVLHTTEPERIVFAGGMIAAGDALLNRIREYFDEHIWSMKKETVEIAFATLGEDAGIIGAAALARRAENN